MSDTEMPSSGPQPNGGVSQSEFEFIVTCLQHHTGAGFINVDAPKVASIYGYKNPRSVSNKISALKKKYNLPFGASSRTAEEVASINASKTGKADTSPSKKASDANGDNEPAIPNTPSKNRVTKAKASKRAAAKKTPAKKSAKKVVSEDEDEDESTDVKDEVMQETKMEDDE